MEKEIAKELLGIKAVFLSPDKPFTWASGIKSPIYCDNRLILTSPEARDKVEKAIAESVKKYYPEAEVLMGTSTAGIAHAAIAAHLLGMPMGYVRGSAKDHGRNNRIEGRLEPGQKVVVIEDLISTGGSSLKAVEAIRAAGCEVVGMAAIFTYGFPIAEKRFKDANVNICTLSNYNSMLEAALATDYIRKEDLETLREWRHDPANWTPNTNN